MRKVPVLSAAAASLVLMGAVPPAVAARGFHGCQNFRTRAGRVTNVHSQYGCQYTRKKLRSMLHRGVARIPSARAHSGRWGCRLAGQTWSCGKYPHRGKPVRRIRFRLEIEIDSGGDGPPSGGGPPAPVNPLQRCADLWNGDTLNRNLFGYHIYTHHGVRRLWVFALPHSTRCAVIAVVPATDPEFGNDGEVSGPGGTWAFMKDVPELGDPVAVQTQAFANANASLAADYSLKLD
jgi:hypothetical protein